MSRMSEVSHDSRDTFAEAAQAFVELVRAVPPDAWDGPGLGEWDLRSLVAHTSRSLITVETYLSQPANREDVVSAAAYYAAISTIDPAAVAGRGREAGRALGDDPVAAIQSLVTRVLGVVERAENPLITSAAGGVRLRTYLPTRTFELVVHGLDIAAAANLPAPDYGYTLLSEVAEVAARAAVLQGRGLQLIRALTSRAPLPDGFSVVCGQVRSGLNWAAARPGQTERGKSYVASTNDLKNGMVLDLDGQLWSVLWFQHHKPGKGNTVVRTKLKHVLSGKVVDRTFNADTKVDTATVDRREMQYLYHDGSGFGFMDTTTYDQMSIAEQTVGDAKNYLLEGQLATVAMHEGSPLYLDLPAFV